ncbi:MAG: YraN family protein [Bacteroidia bacterium]|nr:YraN family protein [Bacteroidia bacterium]MCX7764042.1 YraN family protein [Bacteroidia bacterium]MDW8057071.1 YraN family protein [Bacteroidia bacterium]
MAAEALRSRGYKLLYQRWRKGIYEIDFIAWHQNELVFVEVRTVGKTVEWPAEASITSRKRRGLQRAIEAFFHEHPSYERLPARIDVVAIRMNDPPEVLIFPDAFR